MTGGPVAPTHGATYVHLVATVPVFCGDRLSGHAIAWQQRVQHVTPPTRPPSIPPPLERAVSMPITTAARSILLHDVGDVWTCRDWPPCGVSAVRPRRLPRRQAWSSSSAAVTTCIRPAIVVCIRGPSRCRHRPRAATTGAVARHGAMRSQPVDGIRNRPRAVFDHHRRALQQGSSPRGGGVSLLLGRSLPVQAPA